MQEQAIKYLVNLSSEHLHDKESPTCKCCPSVIEHRGIRFIIHKPLDATKESFISENPEYLDRILASEGTVFWDK